MSTTVRTSPAMALDVQPVSLRYAAERTPEGNAAHEGETVRVSGTVTVSGNAFYGDLLKTFIQDDSGALCLFTRRPVGSVEVGDRVEVEGRIQSYFGTVELQTTRLTVTARGFVLSPLAVPPEALLSHRLSGRLVQTEGAIAGASLEPSGLNAAIAVGSGVLVIHLTKRQVESFPRHVLSRGATVSVRGIASQFDPTPPHESGWQILPRDPSDVRVVRAPPLFTGRDAGIAAAAVAGALLAFGAWNFLLRREVRRQTLKLQRALEDAERAMRLKDELVSIVAHEFRSPLALILGYSDTLQKGTHDEATRHALAIVNKYAERLAALVADTLAMSRIEAGGLPLSTKPVALTDLIRAEVDSHRAASAGAGIHLEVPAEPIVVIADPDRLQDVIDNLLDNAIKFSPEGPRLHVTVRKMEREAEVSVADQGLSIPSEEMPKLFQKFSRLDAARRGQIPGTGLGLYICRAIVEAHGGRIWAESDGHGSTFSFVVPLAPQGGSA